MSVIELLVSIKEQCGIVDCEEVTTIRFINVD